MTYAQLTDKMTKNGNNLAEVAIGRMMTIVEEQTGEFPSWDDQAPEWVINNSIGRTKT